MTDFVLYKAGQNTVRARVDRRLPDGRLTVTPFFFQNEKGEDSGPFVGGSVTLGAGDCYTEMPSEKTDNVETLIETVIRNVAELPDRTSPENQPDMMLVSAEELRVILKDAVEKGNLVESDATSIG